jgi:hypothetical protein
MSVKEDIRAQIIMELKHAKFPIDTPETLLGSFPDGGQTTCRSGDVVLTVQDASKLIKPNDFPFKSAQEVAKVIVDRAGL